MMKPLSQLAKGIFHILSDEASEEYIYSLECVGFCVCMLFCIIYDISAFFQTLANPILIIFYFLFQIVIIVAGKLTRCVTLIIFILLMPRMFIFSATTLLMLSYLSNKNNFNVFQSFWRSKSWLNTPAQINAFTLALKVLQLDLNSDPAIIRQNLHIQTRMKTFKTKMIPSLKTFVIFMSCLGIILTTCSLTIFFVFLSFLSIVFWKHVIFYTNCIFFYSVSCEKSTFIPISAKMQQLAQYFLLHMDFYDMLQNGGVVYSFRSTTIQALFKSKTCLDVCLLIAQFDKRILFDMNGNKKEKISTISNKN